MGHKIGRRDFLRAGTAGIPLGLLGGCIIEKTAETPGLYLDAEAPPASRPRLSVPKEVPPGNGRLIRMHQELAQAVRRPVEEVRWKMVINTNQCIGCHACEVACIAENVSPPGVTLRRVFPMGYGTFPNVKRVFAPTNCMHCNNPPCIEAAPKGGMERRPDGIVMIYPSRFKDRAAVDAVMKACPYKNAIFYDDGTYFTLGVGDTEKKDSLQPYEKALNYQYGSVNKRKRLVGLPRKCDFCLHRLQNGMLPACVTTCVGGAMHFGDGNDPNSLVSELMRTNKVIEINGFLGTEPNVVYIAPEVPGVIEGLKSCMACHRVDTK